MASIIPRKYLSFMVASNIPILLTSVAAYHKAYYLDALIYGLTSITSIIYHRSRESRLAKLDFLLAMTSLIFNLLKFRENPTLPLGIVAITGLLAFLRCFKCKKHYELYHPIWHIIAGCGTLTLYLYY